MKELQVEIWVRTSWLVALQKMCAYYHTRVKLLSTRPYELSSSAPATMVLLQFSDVESAWFLGRAWEVEKAGFGNE